jgi:ribonuclease P/MRP protein subunit RPP40
MFDNGLSWDTVYLDFAKAFDSVPHERLIRKVESVGIRGKILEWIKDFLKDRKQRVVMGNSKSSWADITSGISQGSVFGPILFVIFINDLPSKINSYVKIFADDTNIFRALRSIRDISMSQEDISKLLLWSTAWQLPFNVAKCKLLHFGKNNPEYSYSMNNSLIKQDVGEKDLGVSFCSDSTFNTHISQIIAKANSRVGIIKHTFTSLNKQNFMILYKSLVRPILEYCS